MSTTEHSLSTADQAQVQQAVAQTDAVPPAGEDIHLPGGSVLPLVVAVGVTLMVIGTTIWWVWSALGGIITATAVGLWIRDVRHDVDELPEEHHH